MTLTAGTRLGAYEILDLLGAGGMGEVYRARDARLKRDVALKVLPAAFAADPDRLARFQREAELLASLNHPNIAAIYGIESTTSGTALVLELVEGDTLADRIAQGPIPIDEALTIAKQIAEALDAAHESGIIHRDLKPANIKLRPDGTVKVLDFGLAKLNDPNVSNASNVPNVLSMSPTITSPALTTGGGVILGTAAYMSPEQARGKAVDKRADIWAFGCVLYEMLTGRRAFEGDDITEVIARVCEREPTWDALPPATPPAVRTLLRRCIQKQSSQRLRDIGDARLELVNDDGSAAPQPAAPRRWLTGVGVLVGGVITAIGIYVTQSPPGRDVIRFSLSTPRNSRTELPGAALSPDGRTVAYVASDETGRDVLWIRALDQATPARVDGTAGAYFPFWSPNSEWVGFFAQGKLKKVPARGGSVETITDAPRGWGASWNADDTIVFAPNLRSGLYRVSAAGGTSAALTSLDDSGSGSGHTFPSFASDGRHFVFAATGLTRDRAGIYFGSLDGPPPTRLSPGVDAAIVTGNDYLVFIEDSSVKAQKLDISRGALTGPRLVVATGAPQFGFASEQILSASTTGRLIYAAATTAQRNLLWVDRSGGVQRTIGPPGNYIAPALSPDETKIAVGRDGELWMIDLSRGGTATRIVTRGGAEFYPLWSPDGRHLVFSSNRDGGQKLYRRLASGTGEDEPLADGLAAFDWSKDGHFVAFFKSNPGTGDDTYVLPMTGDGKPLPFRVTRFDEYEHQFSPDGKWAVYVSEESGDPEVYLVSYPPGDERIQVSVGGGVQPSWRADGKEIFYLALDGRLMALDVGPGVPPAVSAPRPLFRIKTLARYTRNSYVPSRDGQRFLVNSYLETETATLGLILNWPELLKR